MHTILLVDDEPVTRNGLKTLVNWAELGLKLIAEADDGSTALPLLQQLKPDILLTDVRMPGMDGLALAKEAQFLLPQLKTVFISGYSDVDYVRSALKMGAYDYILKPIDMNELHACLSKVVKRLESESKAKISMDLLERQAEQGRPLIKQQLLSRLMLDTTAPPVQVLERLETLGVAAPDREYCVLLLSPDEGEAERCQGFQDNWKLLETAICNISQEILLSCAPCHFLEDPLVQQQPVVVLAAKSGILQENQIYAAAANLCQVLKKYLQLSLSVGIGSIVPSLTLLQNSYQTATSALKHRLYRGGAQVLVSAAETAEPQPAAATAGAEQIQELLRSPEEKHLLQWLAAYFRHLAATRNTDISFYRARVSQIIFETYVVLQEELSGSGESDLNHQNILDKLYKTQSLSQMEKLITGYCTDVQTLIRLKNDDATKGIIQQVKKRIQAEFHHPLTINELAADVYLSPTYLCMLFRQEAGITINNFQTQVRMENAKRLLSDYRNKLYDISEAVGYSNPSYFSRQFKKYTGMLPSEYRNRMGGEA